MFAHSQNDCLSPQGRLSQLTSGILTEFVFRDVKSKLCSVISSIANDFPTRESLMIGLKDYIAY